MNGKSNTRPPPSHDVVALAQALVGDVLGYFGEATAPMHRIERHTLREAQFLALRHRFNDARGRLAMLEKLADAQGVQELGELNDVVPLLFPHTVYKSYPPSLLADGRFDQMNRWLAKLTTIDVTAVDVSGCVGIDDWMAALDANTDLQVRHSSGTSGTMSFAPRSRAEAELGGFLSQLPHFEVRGLQPPLPGRPLSMDVVVPNYRGGSSSHLRVIDFLLRNVCGGDAAKLHTLYPYEQSADLLALAGRMNAAAARGDLDRLKISPALLDRKAHFEEMQKAAPAFMDAFIEDILANLRDRQVYMQSTWNLLHRIAGEGLARGTEGLFAPGSVIRSGGGAKGMTPPEDWDRDVMRFTGSPAITYIYAMTELTGAAMLCEHGRYHLPPTWVFWTLDPDTGTPLPREGVQTGRAAFFDLLPSTYWGGFVSGDEVTVDWDPCACGQTSPHLHRHIERYSEQRGGDDKITCAAAPEAHESALRFLNDAMV